MKVSKLLEMMFETERWQELLDNATEKEIDLKVIKELCNPDERKKLFLALAYDKYNIIPPRIGKIPKENKGEYREVFINDPRDRIVLTLVNDCLAEMFQYMVHPQCKSYQKGIGTQRVVKDISNEIVRMSNKGNRMIGYKIDFTKYFDSVKIEVIDSIFDRIESELGFDKETEPVISMLRRYYHQDIYFDADGNLAFKYQSLKQGCAVASFLSNVVMYELDEYLSEKYKIYYRYCDDLVVIDNNTDNVIDEINAIINKFGVTLNPKKVEPLYVDKWFKFLGFNIKGDMITLSKSRVKKFQKEVESRSIKRKCTGEQARRSIMKYLYDGDYSWATSCLSIINVDSDINELNKFIMDCIKACDTGKKKIGGLGSVDNLPDRTILRGTGKNVKANKNKVGHIENYLTVKCLNNDIKISKVVFDTAVRGVIV